jgi:hypothetical protein
LSNPHVGIILCFYAFDLPQFKGTRMAAATVILIMFGVASIPLTYLCSFLFTDEMKALQVCLGCRCAQPEFCWCSKLLIFRAVKLL